MATVRMGVYTKNRITRQSPAPAAERPALLPEEGVSPAASWSPPAGAYGARDDKLPADAESCPRPTLVPEESGAESSESPAGIGWRPRVQETAAPRSVPITASRGHIVGEARYVEQQTSPYTQGKPALQTKHFRLMTYNDKGDALPAVQVEMTAQTFAGTVSEGDWVEVQTKRGGGTVYPTKIYNHTTRTWVRARSPNVLVRFLGMLVSIPFRIMAIIFSLIFLGGFFYLVLSLLSEWLNRR